jgi:hypothetical protein
MSRMGAYDNSLNRQFTSPRILHFGVVR